MNTRDKMTDKEWESINPCFWYEDTGCFWGGKEMVFKIHILTDLARSKKEGSRYTMTQWTLTKKQILDLRKSLDVVIEGLGFDK